MRDRGLIFFLMFLAGLEGNGLAALCARRSLFFNTATTGMCLEVSIRLTFSETTPAALILTETLPDGLQLQSASWNGKPFLPSVQDRQTLKWFFGPGGEPVSQGILLYPVHVLTESSQKVFISGSVLLSGSGSVPVEGDRILWLNPPECVAPEFSPASGTVFDGELQVSLSGADEPGSEIFLCFGEALCWEDWQRYEGAFTILHSQQFQAETWMEDGRASARTAAEYYRRGTCEIKLRQGWNLTGIPLELSVEENRKLQEFRRFDPDRLQMQDPEEGIRCGQVFWIFSERDSSLSVAGIEPFQRGVRAFGKTGWEAVSPAGLEEDILPASSEIFWYWEDHRYQTATRLKPGKGYWRFRQP